MGKMGAFVSVRSVITINIDAVVGRHFYYREPSVVQTGYRIAPLFFLTQQGFRQT
ncbi:MAG: hypothetical protein RLY14_3240 [Planctomycetota bacterium]|jgi:hypothetical protein